MFFEGAADVFGTGDASSGFGDDDDFEEPDECDACDELHSDFGCVPSTKYAVVDGHVDVASPPEIVHMDFSTTFAGGVSSFLGSEL